MSIMDEQRSSYTGPDSMGTVLTASESAFSGTPNYSLSIEWITAAINYQESAAISDHLFFDAAANRPELLRFWAEQEYLTSACFSQIVAKWMAGIHNFHIRTLVLPVLAGEHNALVGDLAVRSHPSLARKLCISISSDVPNIVVAETTVQFLDELLASAADPLFGAGFIGIGNERLLIPEYRAVRSCFERALPSAAYREFLDANIDDDIEHSGLITKAAVGLVSLGGDAKHFWEGAKAGVDARIRYYDRLLAKI